jgi:hypothetical protein
MMTLRRFAGKFESVPVSTSWYLTDLGEARGKQELFTRQSPQRLKALREHGLIESAVSSNRIEGVEVDMIRRVLKNLRSENRVECLGRGQSARWRKTGKWELGNTE